MYKRFVIALLSISLVFTSVAEVEKRVEPSEPLETQTTTSDDDKAQVLQIHELDDSDDSYTNDPVNDPYYIEGSVIDLEKLLENDPELREKYDSLSKEERKAFLEVLATFNEAFQAAFQALIPD